MVALARGLSRVEAALEAGMSPRTLYRRLAERQDRPMPMIEGWEPRLGSLTLRDRVMISVGIERGESDAVIARGVGCARSSVWREVAGNGGRAGYDPADAHRRAFTASRRPRALWVESRPWLWDQVCDQLRDKWSPEQISQRLRRQHPDDPDWWVSHETIYEAIFVQAKPELRTELAACLRSGRARRVPRGHRRVGRGSKIPAMVNISERPAEIEDRAVPGHWEGDLIIGKDGGSQVATLVERSTRYGMLIRLDSKTAEHVAERISEEITRLPVELALSLTWDQGTELAAHQRFSVATGIPVFFCDPHSPWQRGSNENWNGLVRQYLPKGTDLSGYTQDDLNAIARSLNGRPRKTLNWQTPAEQLTELVATTT
jgi:IS30 family transposase